ncbi:transmembrane sensor [Sphingopyxis panaciterrae]|uniref:FecR domain-containing protein n=1 Tax=Sphingopyxis panaciterrae TaxID=363841 RepID=UPI001420E7DD|nr:transmembrane sensor [Sphingopyxis panaciterrae]
MSNDAYLYDADQERIDEQASEWIVLFDERELTAFEQNEFEIWLAADPRHRDTWTELSRTWATLPVLDVGQGAPAVPPPAPASRWSRMRTPKIALGGFGAIAAAFLIFALSPSLLSRPLVYQTDVAQTQLLTLDDGSQVTLGPKSKLTVKFGERDRRVVLGGGEAFFEVAHNKKRPFFVEAGQSVTRVVGTKFDVNYAADSVRVAVLEGLVQVSRPDPDPAERSAVAMLRAGQRAEISLDARMTAATAISRRPAPTPGAWREGRLVYENSRLADLVSDVNRYYAPGVTVNDKAILDLRVTASFKASEIPAFLASVGTVLPVSATATGGGSYRLESADK